MCIVYSQFYKRDGEILRCAEKTAYLKKSIINKKKDQLIEFFLLYCFQTLNSIKHKSVDEEV